MSEWILPPGKFLLELTMESDWHVGSGAGRPGDIDRLVRRDPIEGLPFVPAKTLTGIWRDACERVAFGLDNSQPDGRWSKWVEYLFGEQPALYDRKRTQGGEASPKDSSELVQPRPSALSIRPAYLPSDLRLALQAKCAVREAITFTKPGVAIHPRTGRARQDFLRFEEMGRVQASLTAECELTLATEADRKIATALLQAGAQFVERLGGRRRRGAGRCKLGIVGKEFGNHQQLVEILSELPGLPPAIASVPTQEKWEDGSTATPDAWVCIELLLYPRLPVVIPAHTVGNLIETLDYIPGSYLLPIISRKLRAAGVNINAAIANKALVVSNATMVLGSKRARPVPLSLVQEKQAGLDKGGGVYNRFLEQKPNGEPTKSHSPGYVGDEAGTLNLPGFDKPDLRVETHNVIKDEVQRPTSDVGGVYSYQAVDPLKENRRTKETEPLVFKATLRLRRDYANALKTSWSDALDGDCQIGRASKDDYGLISLKADEAQAAPKPAFENTLTVWLLSDALIRDERLRPSASIKRLGDTIARELGQLSGHPVTLELKKVLPESKLIVAAAKQRRTDSWHVQWGFPRPTLAGLQAGSCAVFAVVGASNFTADHLAAIEQSGIGERRAEGYGQLCFNDPLVTNGIKDWKAVEPTTTSENSGQEVKRNPLVTPDGTYEYARLIEREAIRKELQRSAVGWAANDGWRKNALGISVISNKPTMSQLGGFRSVVAQLQSSDSPERETVLSWLAYTHESRNRERAWPKATLWHMQELIETPDRVWELLKIDFKQLILTTSETNQATSSETERKQELWAEAVKILVDACVRAHKRALEKETQNAA